MIYYDFIPNSLVGDVLIAASEKGLCAVIFGRRTKKGHVKKLMQMFATEPVARRPAFMRPYRRELKDYFAGKLRKFTQPIDLSAIHGPFQRKVLQRLARLPFGQLISYGELAVRSGSPKAARAVGSAMAANPLPVVIPCHRVVESRGKLGGYSAGLSKKKKLLAHEGVLPEQLNL
ncbi:MAG: methylated-DNA--[protein]-cysteine S-methyltransferase [Candidatus Krumholzibacteria bacterium]|nr:methylated-DNA--[protein]-cysteine S-methyltransferase [Candidatus Krumholzibacteria bacterium]